MHGVRPTLGDASFREPIRRRMAHGEGQVTAWAGVIGDPIEHSLSPVLHRKAYQLAGLDWEYRRRRVDVDELGDFLSHLDKGCAGLSVTMPLKQHLAQHVDHVESLSRLLHSANTIVFAGGTSAAFNTDVGGIVAALRRVSPAPTAPGVPVVIGTGATASSAVGALASMGHRQVRLLGRNFAGQDNAFLSANRVGVRADTLLLKLTGAVVEAINTAPIVVSTIPHHASAPFAPLLKPREDAVLLDVSYGDGASPLERAFCEAGARSASALAMLTYQGLAQVKLMSGREVPFEPVYKAVVEAASGDSSRP